MSTVYVSHEASRRFVVGLINVDPHDRVEAQLALSQEFPQLEFADIDEEDLNEPRPDGRPQVDLLVAAVSDHANDVRGLPLERLRSLFPRPPMIVLAGPDAEVSTAVCEPADRHSPSAADRPGTLIHLVRQAIAAEQAPDAIEAPQGLALDLLEGMEELVVCAAEDGRIRYANRACRDALGYSENVLRQLTAMELVQPSLREAWAITWQQILVSEQALPVETTLVSHTGMPVEVRGSGRRRSPRPCAEVQLIWSDVSGLKRVEDQLKHSENHLRQSLKMEALGRFVAGIAHDINNLLTVIVGRSEWLRADLPLSEPAHESAISIHSAALRAASLTRQLLSFSRPRPAQDGSVDLNVIVQGIEELLRRVLGEDIDLRTRLAGDRTPVRVEKTQIEQVLLNLAANARDAMPQGGRLEIETALVDRSQGAPPQGISLPAGAYVALTVRDTGCGMDSATLEQVFEPFFTTKPEGEGTGLGLATVRSIVRKAGGEISVESQVGQGTIFRVYWPLDVPLPRPEPSHPSAASLRGGHETILVVEDQPEPREMTVKMLARLGYKVLSADGGEDALRLIEDQANRINLVLTDVVMAGMSGRTLVKQLLTHRSDLKVCYMSGYGSVAVSNAASADLLEKPFGVHSLAQKVREVLDR